MRNQTREEILATIEKLKKQVETIDNKPTLLCIDGFNNGEITKNHKYTIIEETHFNYYMVNNFGIEDFYHKTWFKKLDLNNN